MSWTFFEIQFAKGVWHPGASVAFHAVDLDNTDDEVDPMLQPSDPTETKFTYPVQIASLESSDAD